MGKTATAGLTISSAEVVHRLRRQGWTVTETRRLTGRPYEAREELLAVNVIYEAGRFTEAEWEDTTTSQEGWGMTTEQVTALARFVTNRAEGDPARAVSLAEGQVAYESTVGNYRAAAIWRDVVTELERPTPTEEQEG